MSDPMTRTEIEDVLSSIRRLVSEEERPLPQRVPPSSSTASKIASGTRPARRPEASASAVGRLVLTPALRVADPAPSSSDSLADIPAAEDWQPERAPAGGREDMAEAWQPEAEPAGPAARDDWQPEVEADAAPAAAAARSGMLPALEATIAELEAAVAARREEWDPDGSEEPGPGDLTRPVGRGAFAAIDDDGDAFPAPEPLARPEAGDATPAPEPETPPAAEPLWTSTRRDWQPPLEAETEAETVAPEAEASWDEESIEIDEDALNDLVRQLIRNELQGALGERITRNVRKLVRAEISRALAARKLD
ncbi:hypothetical protein [Acidimangrovimonas pyrenivorans]|uniref:Uncharacterized protein n=1 Tax=Acidimangrovimonas pyrenivorans TaxID=2030798 RepID=A0ABV7ABX4_9RHOB